MLRFLIYMVLIALTIGLLESCDKLHRSVMKYDDTDDVANGVRSGMTIYTDHGTGCQYVSNMLGSMTPRLDEEGKPMCGSVD